MIGKEQIETFKVIIIGEYASGKSALHKRIIRDEFDPYSSQATISNTFATRIFRLSVPGKEPQGD